MKKLASLAPEEVEILRKASDLLRRVLSEELQAQSAERTRCNGCEGSCEGSCKNACWGSCKGGCEGSCRAICSRVCTMLGA